MNSYLLSSQPKLQKGQIIKSANGTTYTVEGFLGEGGQGEVYRVRGNEGSFALKWYHSGFLNQIDKSAFYKNLKRNIDAGTPQLSDGDKATQFIWPLELIPEQNGSFGYIMKLFEPQYESLTNVVMGRKKNKENNQLIPLKWSSWFNLVTAALNIVKAFEILHSLGLSYQDLNEGGISIDMSTGDVMICDCDNVSPDGVNLGIKGVTYYMAPEVICRRQLPDVQTDEYSLAVMLFKLFYHYHPMTGIESKKLHDDENISDEQADNQIFGSAPHFCLDKHSSINRPDKKLHADIYELINIFPITLLDAFHQVFTEGVYNRNSRLTCTEWRKVLLQVRDDLVHVNGMEKFFYTPTGPKIPDIARTLVYPNGHKVLCMPEKILYAYHINVYSKDFTRPVAKVIKTNKADVIGLYNATGMTLKIAFEGKNMSCENNGRMPLLKGMKIDFGKTVVTVN